MRKSVSKIGWENLVDTYAYSDWVPYKTDRFGRLYFERVNSLGKREKLGKVIDFSSAIGATSFGQSNWKLILAWVMQARKIMQINNSFMTKPTVELAQKLNNAVGHGYKTFFVNSGAEANENAVMAATYRENKVNFKKPRPYILTLSDSFHGRTGLMRYATGQSKFRDGLYLDVDKFKQVSVNKPIDEVLLSKTHAIMIEVIQGESGVNPVSKDFATYLKVVCEINDIIMIVDEVQTGIGRTGKMFGYQHYNLCPDIVTTAKGLGGGTPISAVTMNEKAREGIGPGKLGSTFGGNAANCAVANKVMDTLTPKFLDTVEYKGNLFGGQFQHFKRGDLIKDFSGVGMLWGLTLPDGVKASHVKNECLKEGLAVLTAGERLRIMPPLNTSKEAIYDGIDILEYVLRKECQK